MPPATERERVAWSGSEEVWVRRCGPADADALSSWSDVHLAGDYFFRRRHLRGLCGRPGTDVWAVEIEARVIGFVIIYEGTRLWNLYLEAEYRGKGLGSALLRLFRPTTVRAKTNMLAADPTPFYERCGYEVTGQDPQRPWILEMALKEGPDLQTLQPNGAGATISPPASPGVQPKSLSSPAGDKMPQLGMMSQRQVTDLAGKLRTLPDAALVALALTAEKWRRWEQRQQAARMRRLEREKLAAAAEAGQHLAGDLTGEALARAARAEVSRSLAALFEPASPPVNGHA